VAEAREDDGEDVQVDISLTVPHGAPAHLLNVVKVCQITRDDGSAGLGIFTPKWKPWYPRGPHRRGPHFHVRVRLPKPKDAVLYLPSFESDLPLFRHHVNGQGLIFGNLTLSTVHEPIFGKAIEAEYASVSTVNAPIFGDFKASSSIRLATANAPIHASLGLFNEDADSPTTARVETTHAHINVSSTLTAGADNGGGGFAIDAATVRGRIDLQFPSAPVDSVLVLKAETVLAHIDVRLHPTFQGAFALETVHAPVKLDDSSDAEDPAGEGRKRVVKLDYDTKGSVKGETWWGDGKPLGAVSLKTTLAPAVLHL
jgi:hypothetical protein